MKSTRTKKSSAPSHREGGEGRKQSLSSMGDELIVGSDDHKEEKKDFSI
jgi:hypothetical protein